MLFNWVTFKVNGIAIDGREIFEMFITMSPIKIEFVGICKNESEPKIFNVKLM